MPIRLREVTKEDAEGLLGVYCRFAKKYVGLASRDIKVYRRLLRKKENTGWVALSERGIITGYVLARFDKRKREAQLREIVVDPNIESEEVPKLLINKAYKSLLEKKPALILINSVQNMPYAKTFSKLGFLNLQSAGVFMYAILNIQNFLVEISPILRNRLIQLEQWNGLVQIRCDEHSMFIQKQGEDIETLIWTNQEPELTITLNRELLAKLLFGVEDVVRSLRAGKLKIETTLNEKETYQILKRIFPERQFFIMDFW